MDCVYNTHVNAETGIVVRMPDANGINIDFVLRTLMDLIFEGKRPTDKPDTSHCKSRLMLDFTTEFHSIDTMYLPFKIVASCFPLGTMFIDVTMDPGQDNGCLVYIRRMQDPSERNMFVSMKHHSAAQVETMQAVSAAVFGKNASAGQFFDLLKQVVQPHLQHIKYQRDNE